jgi:sigma-E factor negative regulatory protein RseA
MNDDLKQQLSALLDGELDAQRARFLLRRIGNDEQLQASWSRWHLTRACLRRETAGTLRPDFAQVIAQQLENERAPARTGGGQILRWVGGLAVAASVAVAALLAVPVRQATEDALPSDAVAALPAPATLVAASDLSVRDLRPDLARVTQAVATSADPRRHSPALRLDPQLEGYLLRHNAALRSNGDASFLPFVPVVAPARPWSMVPVNGSEPAPR